MLVFVTTDCEACGKELANVSQIVPTLASKVTIYGVGIEDRDSVNTFIGSESRSFSDIVGSWSRDAVAVGFKLMPT